MKTSRKQKIGIFGGSFNPPHVGHVNSVVTVAKELKLSKVFVIPSFQSPGKAAIDAPTPADRLAMVKEAFNDEKKLVKVDDQELVRGGTSYTIDTVKNYAKEYSPEQLHLIIGADAFETFEQWKDFEKILSLVTLVVTTRPGFILPFKADDLPQGFQPLVESMGKDQARLKSGTVIRFVHLKDVGVSATDLRKRLRSGLQVDKFLPFTVENYIHKNSLYKTGPALISDYSELAAFCAELLFDKKGFNVRGFDVSKIESATDYTLIASGTSTRHVSSLGEHVASEVKRKFGLNPLSVEGVREGRWVLVDYGALIVHVFYDFIRQEYNLEELWQKGKTIEFHDRASERMAKSAE